MRQYHLPVDSSVLGVFCFCSSTDEELKKEIATQERQISNLRTTNLNLEKEVVELQNKIDELSTETGTNSAPELEFSKEMDDLKSKLHDTEKEFKAERRKVILLMGKLEELEQSSDHPVKTEEQPVLTTKEHTVEVSDSELQQKLDESNEIIAKQNQTIERIENEMIDLDQKYDAEIIRLKKKVKSLQKDIKILEEKNEKLSSTKFKKVSPKTLTQRDQSSDGDVALLDKMKEILKAWPRGIKLRNLAMSLGISVSVTNDYLDILEKENFVTIDRENAENSNPVIHPINQ